jgi:GNAT superfamily N-acetyltransferase
MRSSARACRLGTSSARKVTIRPARETDLKACARILHTRELAGAGGWYPTPGVLKRCMGRYFLVAEDGGRILGCSVVEPLRYGVIGWWFAVTKGARGRGVGSALLAELERTARRSGKHFFLVYSKVGSKAVEFYRKRGYEGGQNFTELIKQL